MREEDLLKPLLLFQRCLQPELCRSAQEAFREIQDGLYVDVLQIYITKMRFSFCDFHLQAVNSPIVRLLVNSTVEECVN